MPTVDATKSGASANAYMDDVDSLDYIDEMYGTEEWALLGEDDRERQHEIRRKSDHGPTMPGLARPASLRLSGGAQPGA